MADANIKQVWFQNPACLYLLYMATIGVKFNDSIYKNAYTFECKHEKNVVELTVLCDGKDFINHFTIARDGGSGWIAIHRNRNYIRLVINENFGLSERNGKLTFKHNLDKEVFFEFNIKQSGCKYTIDCEEHDIELNTLLDTDEDREFHKVKVKVVGGFYDFGIKPVKQFVINGNGVPEREVVYDNGLSLTKLDNEQLLITNFGKVSMYDNVRYVLTLYHRNNPSITTSINIEYGSVDNNGISFDDE